MHASLNGILCEFVEASTANLIVEIEDSFVNYGHFLYKYDWVWNNKEVLKNKLGY